MSRSPSIECKPNGPYLVKDLPELRSGAGENLPVEPIVALCRCGGSARKPFCDGTHRRNGFTDAKAADRTPDRRQSYRAPGITIHDNRSLCAHAGECTGRLAAVFKYGSEPWIDAGGAPVAEIIETIEHCPSGALSCTLDGHDDRSSPPPRAATITATKDGPYAVQGGVALEGQPWGEGASTEHFTLCRCGGSKNKPFCDGTHWSIGFKG